MAREIQQLRVSTKLIIEFPMTPLPCPQRRKLLSLSTISIVLSRKVDCDINKKGEHIGRAWAIGLPPAEKEKCA